MNYATLTDSRLFRGLSEEDIRSLLKEVPHRELHFQKQEVVFRTQELADHLGIVESGSILVSKIFASGNLIRITEKTPGEMIGEAACFAGSGIYPCELVAEKPTDILLFDKKNIIPLLQKDPRVLENYLGELSDQAFLLNKKVEMLSYHGTDQKLAYFLLTQSDKHHSDHIPVPGSIVKLANQLNVSRTTLHREIKNLEENGILTYQNKLFHLRDRDRLTVILSRD